MPGIQAGFFGVRGECHVRSFPSPLCVAPIIASFLTYLSKILTKPKQTKPFCTAQGTDETPANLEVKRQVVEALQQGNGRRKVALRYPRDHRALFPGDRTVTLHDCLFDGASDGDTFPDGEDQQV